MLPRVPSLPGFVHDCSHSWRRGGARALTLVELLVVLAVIAVISAIVLSAVTVVRTAASRTAGAANLYAIGRAYSAYAADWDNKIPLCERAHDPTGLASGSATLVNSVQRAGFWSAAAPGERLAPLALRSQQPDFAISKVWICPATNASNPFLLTTLDAPPPASTGAANLNHTLWDRMMTSPALVAAAPGPPAETAVFLSYFFFAGDPGNGATAPDGSAVRAYFQDTPAPRSARVSMWPAARAGVFRNLPPMNSSSRTSPSRNPPPPASAKPIMSRPAPVSSGPPPEFSSPPPTAGPTPRSTLKVLP